ncbi:hypothetical protein ACFL6L_01020 [candidate division KSB1 bacterium]
MKLRKAYCIILVLTLFLAGSAEEVITQEEGNFPLQFRNMTLGMGFNSTRYNFTYPELPDMVNADTKQSLLIDLRVNFFTYYNFQVSGVFELWSWTDNSGVRFDIPQNGTNDFAFMLDISHFIPLTDSVELYGGAGGGIHFVANWTKFPRFVPYYETGTLNQLKQITEHKTLFTPNLIGGVQYRLWNGMYMTGEIRHEFSHDLQQWKYIIGFSMFG